MKDLEYYRQCALREARDKVPWFRKVEILYMERRYPNLKCKCNSGSSLSKLRRKKIPYTLTNIRCKECKELKRIEWDYKLEELK